MYALSPDSAIIGAGSLLHVRVTRNSEAELKLMDRNIARCLGRHITNFVSNRELKITQKSPALVRASADENRQKFSEFNRVIMILHLLEI